MDQIKPLNLLQKIYALHRFYRYRWRTEKDDLRYLISRKFQPGIAIDIGANRGIYSYWLCNHFASFESVYAFEPQPILVPYLRALKQSFALSNLSIVPKGLSSESGVLELHYIQPGSGSASYDPVETEGHSKIQTEVTTLDSSFENKEKPVQFIKCDVEGHEFEVFTGGVDLLRRDKPLLLIEICQKMIETPKLPEFLDKIGYRGFFIYHSEVLDISEALKTPYRKQGTSCRNYFFEYSP